MNFGVKLRFGRKLSRKLGITASVRSSLSDENQEINYSIQFVFAIFIATINSVDYSWLQFKDFTAIAGKRTLVAGIRDVAFYLQKELKLMNCCFSLYYILQTHSFAQFASTAIGTVIERIKA